VFDERQEGDVATEERPGLVGSLGELAGAALDLAHNTAQMVACESRVVVRRLALRAGTFFVSLVFAAMGLLLVMSGLALLLASVAGLPVWAAILFVGAVSLTVGGLVARRALRRLGDPDIAFPETLEQFRADFDVISRARRKSGEFPR
jgi:hypothetical protein